MEPPRGASSRAAGCACRRRASPSAATAWVWASTLALALDRRQGNVVVRFLSESDKAHLGEPDRQPQPVQETPGQQWAPAAKPQAEPVTKSALLFFALRFRAHRHTWYSKRMAHQQGATPIHTARRAKRAPEHNFTTMPQTRCNFRRGSGNSDN